MIEKLIYLALGFLLGFYAGHRRFREQVNNLLKSVFNFLSKLEFRNHNNKEDTKVDYKNYYNPGDYCILPGHTMEYCQERYCRDCPTYLEYKNKNNENNEPIGFKENYW